MKAILTLILFLSVILVIAQQKVEWEAEYQLDPQEFKATAPNTGRQQTIYLSHLLEYSFQGYSVLFSNLNGNVSNYFLPESSWLDKGSITDQLLRSAKLGWDLNEIAARKLRKKFHENRLKIGASSANEFYLAIDAENAELLSQYNRETNFGSDEEKHLEWEIRVRQLLEEYSAFCKGCKPPKKKRKK